jgi:hypothetical protein
MIGAMFACGLRRGHKRALRDVLALWPFWAPLLSGFLNLICSKGLGLSVGRLFLAVDGALALMLAAYLRILTLHSRRGP